jgi:adenosylmethionine-8-amino-7-oxononanoate aminotransferase
MAAPRGGAYHLIPGTGPDFVVTRAEGVHLHLDDGRSILDGAAGALVTNIGHGRAEVGEAMAAVLRRVDYVVPVWATEARLRLRERVLRDWLPEQFTAAFFVAGGSEATDSAMRLARAHHAAAGRDGRWKVIGRDVSYHGATLATLSAGGHTGRRKGLGQLLLDLPKVPWDDADALAKTIEREDPDTVAAFIAEPVIGAAGAALVPPEGWWPEVRAVCDRYDVLLIADEVMTGFGRTGTRFGVQHWDVWPDIMVAGKGLAGGYAPLGGFYTTSRVTAPLAEQGQGLMFFTFSAHDASLAAAEVVLDILEREDLVARSARMGAVLRSALEDALGDHPHVADIRGLGLMQGLEYVADRDTGSPFPPERQFGVRVTAEALERGVWLYPAGSGPVVQDGTLVGPPFTVTESHIEQIVGVLAEAIDAAAR